MRARPEGKPLVELVGVGKSFPRVSTSRDRLRALRALLLGRTPSNPSRVLSDIHLTVNRGESLGIIGENGAGKSTLLKVLTGVLAPTAGTVRVHGSVAALLELGAGFHQEFSGRDNIRMAGALMGFTARELADKTDEIIAFADIGDYIDEPVKHYSSGMVVRLGFALVAARRPDLLITDEVLAVGDESFQRKCIRWIEDYLGAGGTLMLVSHSMYHVQKLCQRACWIHQGGVHSIGPVHEVSQEYLAFQERKIAAGQEQREQSGGQEFWIEDLAIAGVDSEHRLADGGDLVVDLTIGARSDRVPNGGVGLLRMDGTAVYGVISDMESAQPSSADRRHRFRMRFRAPALLPGAYFVRGTAFDPEGLRLFDVREREFRVVGDSREFGLVRLAHSWETPEAPRGEPST